MPQHAPQISTLVASERAWRIPVIVVTFISTALVAALLACALWHSHALVWLACAVPALALSLSNLHYLRTHALPTVGMIPVALISLIPALTSVLLTGEVAPFARTACLVALVPLLLVLAVFALWFCRLRATYSHQPDISPTAVLIVLGAAIKHGRPSHTLALRLDVAARLWHEQPTRTVVCTGGPTPDRRTTEADEMARYLRNRGVPAERIVCEREARNTRENILNSQGLLEQRGMKGQVCVVSSDYHLWRALREARRVGVDLVPIAAPTPRASILQQWCREVLTILLGR